MSNKLKYNYTGILYVCNKHGEDAITVGRIGRMWLSCCWREHLNETGKSYCRSCDKEFFIEADECPNCKGSLDTYLSLLKKDVENLTKRRIRKTSC